MNADDRLDQQIRAALEWQAERTARRAPSLMQSARAVASSLGPRRSDLGTVVLVRQSSTSGLPLALLLLLVALLAIGIGVGSGLIQVPSRLVVPLGLAANGQVAYNRAGDIWLGDPRSGDTQPFLADRALERSPAWSHDGTRLAFLRDDGSGEKLFIVEVDGSGLLELTADPLLDALVPRWSPDGRSIAIEHTVGGRVGVSVIRTDGGGVQRLDLDVSASAPEWRPPDGRQLLVRGVARTGEPNLYTVNPDGGGLRSLELVGSGLDGGVTDFLGASWSPDGRRILYGGLEFEDPISGVNRYRTHIVNADGTGDRLIQAPADLSDVWPAWSPDGRFIHFERVRGDYLGQGAQAWLAIAAADGPGLVEITGIPDPSGLEAIWSPDGTRLLARYASTAALYEIDPVAGTVRVLPWTTGRDFSWQRR